MGLAKIVLDQLVLDQCYMNGNGCPYIPISHVIGNIWVFIYEKPRKITFKSTIACQDFDYFEQYVKIIRSLADTL